MATSRRAVVRVAFALVLGAPATAAAQLVEVRLREDGSRAPIAGAVVRLLRDTAVVAQALTNATGRAVVQTPGPGTYRVRVNRIGYAALVSDTVTVDREDQIVTRELAMSTVAVVLPALAVQTKSDCGARAADGALAGALWEQIRTALDANVVTQKQWALPLHVKAFRRDLTKEAVLTKEVVTGEYIVRGPPFGTPDPASLLSKGYAYLVGDEMTFVAPDAALFLSDDFARTHCFRAVAGTSDSIVGLAFEPAPRRRLSDVRGTLWMNAQTKELRFLEYSYTNLRPELSELGLGGRVEYRRLPTGAWIVGYWHIRMPRMAEVPKGYFERKRSVAHLAGYVDVGGVVEIARGASVARATITGRAFDSTASSPLVGAIVKLVGQSDSTVTDADGRFTLTSTTGGLQTLTATHPRLGLIGDGSSRDLTLSIGDSTVVDFAAPTAARVAQEFCGVTGKQSGLVGFASGADGAAAEGLDVRVNWGKAPGAPGEERGQSGPRGIYVFCDLPSGEPLTIRSMVAAVPLTERALTLKPGEFVWLDLKPPAR